MNESNQEKVTPNNPENNIEIKDVLAEKLLFEKDGNVPNSKFPTLAHQGLINFKENQTENTGENVDKIIGPNGWYRDWTYHVYPFLHYHSTAYEGLLIYQGEARIQIGGKNGKVLNVKSGDFIIIPPGVGHERLIDAIDEEEKRKEIESLVVFGLYPNGQKWDFISENPDANIEGGLLIDEEKTLSIAEKNISEVPIPEKHPFYGGSIF